MGIYLAIGGEPQGPFTAEELQAMWHAGQVPAGALYWYEGRTAWTPVEQFELSSAGPAPVAPNTVILTTSPFVANREIEGEREIVSAECVFE